MKHTRALLGASLVAASLVAACSGDDGPRTSATSAGSSSLGKIQSAVIKGKVSTTDQDAVILLIHYESSDPYGVGACTGTLLSDQIVLTARHCVADTDEAAACDEKGNPIQGGAVKGNHKASSLYVFTGKDRPDFSRGDVKPAAQGSKILDTGSKTLCNSDIAIIILDKPIAGAKIAPVRLDEGVAKGEVITSVGWGVTDRTAQPEQRQQRAGVKVTGIGPDGAALPPIAPNEFQVGESICSGDSGGPAVAESGAVIGVVSRGGNGRGSAGNDPSANCIGALNLYTKVSPFKDLVLKAFEVTGGEPWIEGGPDPRLAIAGSACADAAECRSNLCITDPGQANATTCATDCSASDCPEGQVCDVEGDVKVCRTPEVANRAKSTTTTTSCAATTNAGGGANAGLALALAAFGTVLLRRRRTR
jgi:V8-like Glu-specific endopeptidase